MYNSLTSQSSTKKIVIDQAGKRLVDSVIKNRLNAEMPQIKSNIQLLLHNNDPFKEKRKEIIIKRRKVGIGSNERERARRSLSFSPFPQPQQSDRQIDVDLKRKMFESPLVDAQSGQELNKARLNRDNLYVQMGELTKPKYESDPSKASQKAYESLQPSLNIAGKHYIVSVLDEQELPKRSFSNDLSSQHSFVKEHPQDKQTMELYEPKKFNKMDMQTLDKWFQQSVQAIQSQKSKLSDRDYLHRLFGVYICSFKQYIRFTYVDSIDKATLLQKLLWSFISVFDRIMQLQHKVNYNQFKQHRRQFNDMKQLFEQRQADLLALNQKLQQQNKQLNSTYSRLIVVHASYRRVNKQLVYQTEQFAKLVKDLRTAHEHLKFQHFKLLRELQETGRINQINDKYYIVNKFNSPQILTHFTQGPTEFQNFQTELQRARATESQLAKIWYQIDDDFQLHKMIHPDQLFPRTADVCIQSQNIVTFYDEVGIQNYSLCSHLSDISMASEDKFQNFLGKELESEKRQKEESALIISLRELYDQVYTDNIKLRAVNKRLQDNIAHQTSYNANLLKEMSQLREKNLWQEAVVKETRLQLDVVYKQNAQKQAQIDQLRKRTEDLEHQLKSQRFNNQVFVKNEMQLRKKIEKMDKDHAAKVKELQSQIKQLKIKITKGVVVFNEYLDLIENATDNRYVEIGNKIEEIFKEELNREEKDVSPFITK